MANAWPALTVDDNQDRGAKDGQRGAGVEDPAHGRGWPSTFLLVITVSYGFGTLNLPSAR